MAKHGLTIKQKLFIENYLKNGGNATQAVIDAGYKVKNDVVAQAIGYENLLKPQVKNEIEFRKAEIEKKIEKEAEVTAVEIAKEFKKLAMSNIQDFTGEDNIILDVSQIDREKAAAVESIQSTLTITSNKDGSREYETKNIKLKLHSKLDALDKLAKHIGFYAKDNDQRKGLTIIEILALIDGNSNNRRTQIDSRAV